MKTRIGLLILVLGGMLGSCGSAPKALVGSDESTEVDRLVKERAFRIESDWARPLTTSSLNQVSNAGLLPAGSTASRINLIGNPNYLDLNGDRVNAYLPFYGEQQMGLARTRIDNAIKFEGVPEDLTIEETEDRSAYEMRFNIKDVTESYRVTVLLYPNKRTLISVFSSHRFPMKYEGEIERLPEDQLAKVQP